MIEMIEISKTTILKTDPNHEKSSYFDDMTNFDFNLRKYFAAMHSFYFLRQSSRVSSSRWRHDSLLTWSSWSSFSSLSIFRISRSVFSFELQTVQKCVEKLVPLAAPRTSLNAHAADDVLVSFSKGIEQIVARQWGAGGFWYLYCAIFNHSIIRNESWGSPQKQTIEFLSIGY